MEADRRKFDINNAELMKAVKLEVNNHVGRILESYRSGNGDEVSSRKVEKRRVIETEGFSESGDDSISSNKYIRL